MSSSPIPEATLAAITDAIFHGRKIEAIKHYREATGLGLKESKESVEKLEAELRATSPEKFTAPAAKGCLSLLALAALGAAIGLGGALARIG